jgi:mxaJ protein
MSGPMRIALILATLLGAAPVLAANLRVCADPNNLPFSNRHEEGFENKIAALIAHDLGLSVRYTWWAQRRGYVRNTLKAQNCDLWAGVATDVEMVLPTQPYYRASYVFVSRADRHIDVASFDDPALRRLTIGVQMIGDDGDNTPPAHALATRGIIDNVRGFMIYGDYTTPNPPARIIDAVDRGDIDLAVVWGPLAGYFAGKAKHPLTLTAVAATGDDTAPMQFDISVGVRKNDTAFKQSVDRVLMRRAREIGAILARYGVPAVEQFTARKPATGARAYVSNEKGAVIEIDLDTFKPLKALDVGGKTPRGIGITRNGRLLVTANKDTGDISLIDTSPGHTTRRIRVGPSPEFVRVQADTAFVTYEPGSATASSPGESRPAEIAVVDLALGAVTHSTPSGAETEGVAFSADGKTLVATNEGDQTLTVADVATGKDIRKIDTRSFGLRPRGIARLPDGSGYAVTFESSSTLVIFDNQFRLVHEAPTKLGPYGVAFDPTGKTLLVAAARANLLQVFDANTLALKEEVPVGRRCWHFTFTPDGADILVACGRSNEVQVIDAASYKHVTAIRGLDMPWGIVTAPKGYGTLDAPETVLPMRSAGR